MNTTGKLSTQQSISSAWMHKAKQWQYWIIDPLDMKLEQSTQQGIPSAWLHKAKQWQYWIIEPLDLKLEKKNLWSEMK